MSAKQQLEKEIREAITFLRENNYTVPSDTIQFMLQASLEKADGIVLPNERLINTVEDIKKEISTLQVGERWKYPRTLSPDEVNEVLHDLGYEEYIEDDWNGHDLDWSMRDDLEVDGMAFDIWGCATSGSFMMRRKS